MKAISGFNTQDIVFKYFDNSFFREYFDINDPEVLTWALSVLEKLYGKGILPDYIERNLVPNNPFEDEDLISFLYTKTHFFAILVKYIRVLTNISGNDTIKRHFIDQIGLYYRTNETSEDLDYILRNYISEFKKRGTKLVSTAKGILNQQVDGEILRLVDYKYGDEFMFALLNNSEHGWCLGNSSPAYSATDHAVNLIKAYEFTDAVQNIALYPLLNSQYMSLINNSIRITLENGSTITSGIQFDNDETKKIVVDPTLDYEISFKVIWKTSAGMVDPTIEFGVDVFDIDGNNLSLRSVSTGSTVSNNLFCNFTPSLNDTQYWIRGVLSNANRAIDVNDKLNIGIGTNLRFQSNEKFIVPRIIVSGTHCVVEITNVKIRLISFSSNLTVLGIKNLIVGALENNKGIPDNSIVSIIKNELIPYNCFLLADFILSLPPLPSTIIPIADFAQNAIVINSFQSIQFTDLSTNTPISWVWDFGDGVTSTQQNPLHIYNLAGTYTVSLVATNSAGSDTVVKTNLITVNQIVGRILMSIGRLGGILVSVNNGLAFTDTHQVIGGMGSSLKISLVNLDNGVTLAADDLGKIYTSYDGGSSFVKSITVTSPLGINFIKIINSGNIICCTSTTFYLSTDYGNTWINKGGITGIPVISALKTFNSNIYVGDTGGSIWESTNNGTSWSKILNGTGHSWGPITTITLIDTNNFFAGTDMANRLLSTDGGSTWQDFGNYNAIPPNTIVDSDVLSDGSFVFIQGNYLIKQFPDMISSKVNPVIPSSNLTICKNSGGTFIVGENGAYWRNISDPINWNIGSTWIRRSISKTNIYSIIKF